MTKKPIILIDDDPDDLELMADAIKEIDPEIEVISFSDPFKFLDFIRGTEKVSLFIVCDINMGRLNGLELKKRLYDDERLRLKCIPFIFLTTSRASSTVEAAYSFNVQGYFTKPDSVESIKALFQKMIAYWSISELPNCGK